MTRRKLMASLACVALVAALAIPAWAQRGKAELKAGSGTITIDYGRPALQGRDMLSRLGTGSFWRMGKDQAAVLTTPVDLHFGDTKIASGSYSIWLKKTGADAYQLVFNSQTGQWGTVHDTGKDVASVPLKSGKTASPVETFTIELKPATGGGSFEMSWGATMLTAAFKTGS